MRTIKFRVWDKNYQEMQDVAKLIWEEDRVEFVEYAAAMDYDHDDGGIWGNSASEIVLMQYTGLKDKNGTEIYEGDVVKNNDLIWEIFYDEGAYRLRQVGKLGRILLMGESLHSEVIGNLYENPDLLKQQ